MEKKGQLSTVDKIVLAAFSLTGEGKPIFTSEDLVVSAWKSFPDTFGLVGYLDNSGNAILPDSNRVYAEIMGSKPIRKKGFLKKVGTKQYQLTEAGVEKAKTLTGETKDNYVKKSLLGRDTIEKLKRLFLTKAVQKFKDGREEEITFYDACHFWGISPRSSAIQLEGNFKQIKYLVEIAMESLKGDTVSFRQGGRTFGIDDLNILIEVHDEMKRIFDDEISVIKRRTDERKNK